MKKIRVFTLAILLFFLSTNVYAVCDVTESNTLNSLATNVKVSNEVVEVEVPMDENVNPPDGLTEEEDQNFVAYQDYFRIYISNVTEELYVVVTNESTNESKTYTYDDVENGVITFDEKVYVFITSYKIDVYSSDKTNCPDTKLYTLYLTTPLYNSYSETAVCEGIEDFYLCHEYLSVSIDDITYDEFLRLAEEYRAGHIDNNGDEITEPVEDDGGFFGFLGDHLVIVIVVAVIVVAAGGLITFVVIKKQRSRIV